MHKSELPEPQPRPVDGPGLVVGLGVGAEWCQANRQRDAAATLHLLAEAVAEGRVSLDDLRCLAKHSRCPPATVALV